MDVFMETDNNRLAWLFNRYRQGLATEEEQDEYFAMIADGGKDAELTELLNGAWDTFEPGVPVLPETQRREMWRGIVAAAGVPVRTHRVRGWYWAAAASLLLLLSVGAYMRYAPAAGEIAAVKPAPDVVPGSNKAVLTLGDGSTVTLDSSGNRLIAQGAVHIRQQNGQLQYAPANIASEVMYNTLTTPRGGKFRVMLPDGSAVWLNAASSLTYPTAFAAGSRVVELRGQGYFEIAPDPARPFKVKVKDMEVEVLGTSFDIMAYTEESTMNTTLVQGAVKVKTGSSIQLLRPGQQAVISAGSQHIGVQEANVGQVIAWKNDRFIFNDTDLETILREVSRWYDVQIAYTIKPGKEKYNGGLSRHLPLSVVLQLLEDNGNNHFKTDGQKIIVLP